MNCCKKIIATLLVAGIASALINCTKTNDLTKDEIYTIINEIIADDSLHIYRVCTKTDHIPSRAEYGFTKEDQKFIERQKEIFKNFALNPYNLKSYFKKTKKFEFISIDSVCNQGFLTHLSFPLISYDRQRVLIEITEDCNCFLGGEGSKNLYVKQNGHWKKEKTFDKWISKANNPLTAKEKVLN